MEPAKVDGATIPELLDNLKLPEYRTRYRTRRELRGRSTSEVLSALQQWTKGLTKSDPHHEHHLLEALWVSWGLNRVDQSLLSRLLDAKDYRARTAAVRVLRYTGHQVENQASLLIKAAGDSHGRVRLEAIAAASWLSPEHGLPIVKEAGKFPIDDWIRPVHETALAHLQGQTIVTEAIAIPETTLEGKAKALFVKGAEVFRREGHCATCHQENGMGLPAAQFPPIAGTRWAQGNEERLIKLTLNGLIGPIEVKGINYPGQVPMTQFRGLSDIEIAAVLTYVRNAWGNKASVITPAKVKAVRSTIKNHTGFYEASNLLKDHPHKYAN